MLPRRKSIAAKIQISRIPWHEGVFVNQKTVSEDKPVTSCKMNTRTVMKLRKQPVLEFGAKFIATVCNSCHFPNTAGVRSERVIFVENQSPFQASAKRVMKSCYRSKQG